MTLSLYDALIPSQIQILNAVSGLLNKIEAFCAEKNYSEAEIVGAKLADDMMPFSYQVRSLFDHSVGSIEGVHKGLYSPNMAPPPSTVNELKELIETSISTLSVIKPDEINSVIGQDMRFSMGDFTLDFTAENFLLSFSQPNFYFHATTAYDILRMKGMNIGKADFLGPMRINA